MIQADNYDVLAEHAYNCTFLVDRTFSVSYCGDGYLSYGDASALINPSTAFTQSADLAIDLGGAPLDVRLDSYMTFVDPTGASLNVVQRSTKKILTILLNTIATPQAQILAGHFTPDFVFYQIRNQGETFLQIHTSK